MKPVTLNVGGCDIEVTAVGAKTFKYLRKVLAKLEGKNLFGTTEDDTLSEEEIDELINLVVELIGHRATKAEVEEVSFDELFNFVNDVIGNLENSVKFHLNEQIKSMTDFFTPSGGSDSVSKAIESFKNAVTAPNSIESEPPKTSSETRNVSNIA